MATHTYPVREPVPDDDPRFTNPKRCGHWGNHRSDGSLCLGWVIGGTTHCTTHAGVRTDVAIAEGKVIKEFSQPERFGLTPLDEDDDRPVDPGDVLLRLVAQAWWRCVRYATEIERLVGEAGTLTEALTGDTYALTEDGSVVKTGEYVRAMIALESAERDRAMTFSTKAVAAGLAERQVAVLERYVDLVQAALEGGLGDAGLPREVQDTVLENVERRLRLVAG